MELLKSSRGNIQIPAFMLSTTKGKVRVDENA